MKKITFLFSMLLAVGLQAQYYNLPALPGNPGSANSEDTEYPVGGGIGPGWTSILPGSNATPAFSPVQTIPFGFNFNGSPVTQYKVSSSGVLTFDVAATTPPSYAHAAIPNAAIPNNSICIWGLAGTGSNDEIVTKTFGTAPNRQHWVQFSSYALANAPSAWAYWSIVLEETTNKIFMVDQRNANIVGAFTVGVQIDATTAYSVAGSPNVPFLSQADFTRADNFHYTFVQGTSAPQYDMVGTSITTKGLLYTGSAPFTISGKFINAGSATITSATANYKINGGATVSAPVSFSAAPYATVSVASPTKWNGTAGVHVVEMWLSNLNGNVDANPSDDKASKNIEVISGLERFSLYETFTSSTCGPCTPANENMEKLFGANQGSHVSIKYQMSWPSTGDPYNTTDGQVRRTYYTVNSVPNVQIDGGWNNNGNSLTESIYFQYKKIPTTVQIYASYNIVGQKVTIYVSLVSNAPISENDLKLHVAIKERHTTANVKTNGETEFFDVMKKMVPNAFGTTVQPMVANQIQTFTLSHTFPGSYRLPTNGATANIINDATEHSVEEFNDLGVVVWLQDVSSKQVHQAAEAGQILSVESFNPETHNLQVFPNPASDVAYVSIDMDRDAKATINVVNVMGQTVYTTANVLESGTSRVALPVGSLSAGVYFVNVEIDGVTQTVKLTVQ